MYSKIECMFVGDAFMNRIEPISSRIPYMHTPGNHEILYGFYHYRFKFSSPRTSWPIPLYKVSVMADCCERCIELLVFGFVSGSC